MKEIKRIVLEEEDLNYLQRLYYEVGARNNVITTLIENHAMDSNDAVLTSPAFQTYNKQLSELTAEFEIAKQKIGQKYVPEEFRSNNAAIWEADFSTGEMVIKA